MSIAPRSGWNQCLQQFGLNPIRSCFILLKIAGLVHYVQELHTTLACHEKRPWHGCTAVISTNFYVLRSKELTADTKCGCCAVLLFAEQNGDAFLAVQDVGHATSSMPSEVQSTATCCSSSCSRASMSACSRRSSRSSCSITGGSSSRGSGSRVGGRCSSRGSRRTP